MPLVERTSALSKRVAQDDPTTALRADHRWTSGGTAASLRQLAPCEVCRQILNQAFDFLRHFQYTLAVDGDEQARHAQRGGLCPLHTWQYATLTSTHGICTGYPALLERLSAEFRARAAPGVSPASVAAQMNAMLPGRETCPVCRVCASAESEAIARIEERFAEQPDDALNSLSVVCLPHLRRVIEALDDADALQALLLREAVILDRIAEDMRRYATKHDAVRRTLASDEEDRAGSNAIVALAGLRNVNLANRNE